jgi:hypothetical protein
MEFVVISCSHTLLDDLLDFFKSANIESFTILPMALGAGQGGGRRLDSVIWPGNNLLALVALDEAKYKILTDWVREYRKAELREGLKLFNLALKEII